MAIPGAFQVAGSILTATSGAVVLYMGCNLITLISVAAIVNLLLTVAWHAHFYTRFQRYRVRFSVSVWKQMLVKVAPLAPLQFATQFNRLASMIMLSFVAGPVSAERAAGYFGPAQQIAYFPLGFLFGLRRAVVPPVADKLNRGERIDQDFAFGVTVAVILFSFPLFVATWFFAKEILLLVFGPGYMESALPLQFLGGAAALWIAAIFPESFLISYPEQKLTRFLFGAYIPPLINIALCIALIPAYGIVGVAFAALASRAVYLIFVLNYCRLFLPLGALSFVRFLGPLAVLSVAFVGCVLAAQSIEQLALRVLAVVALALTGMFVAARRELAGAWTVAFK
jgi:O-antigen/teichoic acid export membrane protein